MKDFSIITVRKENDEHIKFIANIYNDNVTALHGEVIPMAEWKSPLTNNEPDEQNFIVYTGAAPVAWLKLNGLLNNDLAWISMLVVSRKHHRQGAGTFAVQCAEAFVKEKGIAKIAIHTTEDNISAQKLYRQCGYIVTDFGDCTSGDGKARKGYTFEKLLLLNIIYAQLNKSDLHNNMLIDFNRYQEVKQFYSHEGSSLEVRTCDFVEIWDEAKKQAVIKEDFSEVLEYGGRIFGAFDNGKLIGFACIDGRLIGNDKQYLQLVYLHVSCEYRNNGIGKSLFKLCADNAKILGAIKLYISASSAFDSQKFYRKIGLVEAKELVAHLCEKEPFDIQMEYQL